MMIEKRCTPHNRLRRLGWAVAVISMLFSMPKAASAEYKFLFHDPEWGFTDSVEAVERLTPFCDFLGQYLDQPIRPIYLKKADSFESYLAKPEVVLGIMNANLVADKKEAAYIDPLLTAVRAGKATHSKVLLVPNSEDYSDFNALRDKILTIISTDASTLPQQLSSMCDVEMDFPSEFFGEIAPASSGHSAALALVYRFSDAVLTTRGSFERILSKDCSIGEHIKILCASESHPNGNFVQFEDRISEDNRDRLKTALLALPGTENGKSLLAGLSMSGFETLQVKAHTTLPDGEEEFPETVREDHMLLASKAPAESTQEEPTITPQAPTETRPAVPETTSQASAESKPAATAEIPSKEPVESKPEPMVPVIAAKAPADSRQKGPDGAQGQTTEPAETSDYGAETEQNIQYMVREGDSLWTIARKFLSSGAAFTTLLELNNIDNPHLIKPGQIILIPKLQADG